ncbi:MAG: GntR family transcriptional regulator [Lentisphaeria bacterium]|nr:GntR family transcriptional regulator [Lentisphaeria bacterium]
MTLTARTAARLEKRIYAGFYSPDSPLPSTRSLAEQFKVSQRVILLALDILEKKDILVRQERKRVYIKSRSFADGAREVLFFAFGDQLASHGIYQTVNRMILQEGKERKYDFFSRVISSSDALSNARLDHELARLENLGFIDCALVYCFMNEELMAKFLRLPYPVIFIGELPDSGILPEGARMISPNSAELLLSTARYAYRKGCSQLALAYWSRPAQRRYEKIAFEQLKHFCSVRQLPLNLIPVEGQTIREVCRVFEERAGSIADSLPSGALLAAHNIHSDRFDSGLLLRPEQYPGLDFLTQTLYDEKCRIKYVKRDFSDMQRTIIRFIENRETEKHVTVDYKYEIIDPENRAGGKK